jgi:3',5'-cyclic AMP phosphodiesterase CpdA
MRAISRNESSITIGCAPAPRNLSARGNVGSPSREQRSMLARSGFSFALISDTHYWPASEAQRDFSKRVASQEVRDGLLVQASDEVLRHLLTDLGLFVKRGGKFGVHVGDVACGGKTFQQPRGEFEGAMRRYMQQLRERLGTWPVYHLPGNHDVTPGPGGGVADWVRIVGQTAASSAGGGNYREGNYREVLQAGWQLLLLDSMSGVDFDRGGGQIGPAQLRWLEAKLEESQRAGLSVILLTHQVRGR